MMWCILLLAMVHDVVVGQTTTVPSPLDCCSSKIWQATINEVGRRDDTRKHLINDFREIGAMYTDATLNKRVSVRRDTASGVTETRYHDYTTMKLYILLESESCQECRIEYSPGPLNLCVPVNATYRGSSYIGYGNAKLSMETWTDFRNNSQFKITTKRLASGHCYPLTTSLYFDGYIEFERASWFTRVKESVIDSSVFRLRQACQQLDVFLNGGPAPRVKRCQIPVIFSRA